MNFKKADSVFVRLVLVECIAAFIALVLVHRYPDATSTIIDSFLLFTIGFLIGVCIRAIADAIDEDINHFD